MADPIAPSSSSLLSNYLVAADNHNIGNTRTSWLDPQMYAEKIGNVGKFAVTSILSGANSFYNTAAAVGNWAGLDTKQNDTGTFISAIDSDFGKYYRENQESVDLGGFVLGSLIPGLGGIKIFNAGQKALIAAKDTGFIGGNLAKATGLLTPDTQKYIKLAAADINASKTSLSLMNANTYKAMASGLWQNTLEAAAFETVVQATMFKSPILEDQTIGDIVSNVAIGGAIGGVIGGAFNAAKVRGSLKAAVKAEDVARLPFISRPSFAEATSESEKIAQLAYDAEFSLKPNFAISNFDVKASLYADKITRNFNDIRFSINNLAKGDKELGNALADLSAPIVKDGSYVPGFAQSYFESYSGAVRITRAFEVTTQEAKYAGYRAARAAGQQVDEVPEVAARYVKLFGDDAGKVIPDSTFLPSHGDLFQGVDAIKQEVRSYRFSNKLDGTDSWSAMALKGTKAHLEAEARYIWASKILKEVPPGAVISRYDIPVLERAYFDNQLKIKVISGEGPSLETLTIGSKEDLYRIIKESKEEVANMQLYDMSLKASGKIPVELGTEASAKIANVKSSYLEGAPGPSEFEDLFASQSRASQYQARIKERGLSTSTPEASVDPIFLPQYAKVVYEVSKDVAAVKENILDAITYYKAQQQSYIEGAKRVVAKNLGPISEQLPDASDRMMLKVNRSGGGAGLVTNENTNYGDPGSFFAFVGSMTRSAKELFRKETSEALESALVRLGQAPEAALEFESINQKVTRSGQLWVRHTQDGEYLITQRALKQFGDKENLTTLLDDVMVRGDTVVDFDGIFSQLPDDLIQIRTPQALQAIDSHISVSGKRTQSYREIHAQQGKTDAKNPDVYRPIRPNLKDYSHFAFVIDERVTGAGHKTMIHAASEKELAALIDKVPPQYSVLTKAEVEEFKKARHEYEYSRSLNENYINSDLANNGVFSNFFPKSDPTKIVDDILQQHFRESDTLVAELVRLRYEPQFNFLEDLGQAYSKVDTSRFATRVETLEKTSDNPYFNYIKTALDISKINEYPLIFGFNKMLDQGVSKATAAIQDTFRGVKSPEDLEQINTLLDKYGMKPAYYDSALQALANHTAPKGVLTSFVRKANSLLSLFTLGLDPLNALNNAIGSNILRMTELKHLTKAIESGNTEIAGELAQIAKIAVPGVPAEAGQILAPTKLVAQAISSFWKDDGTLLTRYKDLGLIKDRAEQLKLLADDFTLKGTETVGELNGRMSKAFERAKELTDKAEKATGNPLAEEFNRFISANVMDQLTGIAVRRGLMSPAEANSYINTFVNRVEGNIISSQRPLIFQGPIGQAVSLFQSYQFNLIQQLFRYVAEGSKKDLAMLAGLQSTLYGIQSMPAFQFMNVHIIGQLSGNKEHRDTYDAVYGTVGQTAGNFILYGLPSNILQTNIYSRGDINPRQITILPTSLQEIPLVQGWGKFLGSMYDTFGKIKGGAAVWETILQGVEHNGISRPLAGFAQTLQALGPGGQVYSTSSKGSILYSNDLMSLATISRLAGGRPLDEAVVNDALFRVRTYEAARRSDMTELSERIKSTLIQGNQPDEEQVVRFAQRYADLGGKQAGFNKWMMDLYKSANQPQSEKIQQSLTNPFSYKLQLLMGGSDE